MNQFTIIYLKPCTYHNECENGLLDKILLIQKYLKIWNYPYSSTES